MVFSGDIVLLVLRVIYTPVPSGYGVPTRTLQLRLRTPLHALMRTRPMGRGINCGTLHATEPYGTIIPIILPYGVKERAVQQPEGGKHRTQLPRYHHTAQANCAGKLYMWYPYHWLWW